MNTQTKRSLNMGRALVFKPETVRAEVLADRPGNYSLGRVSDGTFWVNYVGRSDECVRTRLLAWCQQATGDTHFKFSYAGSARAAFEKECHNFHDFSPPRNKSHPDRPEGTSWKCPCCDCFK